MLLVKGKTIFTTLEELVNPRHTALLLVDMQNDFMMPGGHFAGIEDCSALREIIPRIKELLLEARHNHVLVIHVMMTFYRDFLAQSPVALYRQLVRLGNKSAASLEKMQPYCVEGTWGWQTIDALAPIDNEVVVRKHRSSAFAGTDLDMILRSNGIQTVVAAGIVTHGCVMATINDAPYYEYYPVLLKDCVASRKKTLHDRALFLISQTKDIVESRRVLAIWEKSASTSLSVRKV